MCLVTYLPTSEGYILSSNRDEQPQRAETTFVQEVINGYQLAYPKDIAGGSWIFASDKLKNIVLLNGAFQLHKRKLPYRMSRGIMVKAYFEYDTTATFLEHFNFKGIEPFTLIIHEPDCFIEFRWDARSKYIQTLDKSKPYVWSSSTLYNSDLQCIRRQHFDSLIKHQTYNLDLAKAIHNNTDLPQDYGFIMERDGRVRTISTTHIHVKSSDTAIYYQNIEMSTSEVLTL